MAKNNMKLKYKPAKRDKNKKNLEVTKQEEVSSIIKTTIIVLVTVGVLYLCVLGMEKLGTFEKGYTKPEKEETVIDYEFIDIGTVFNRSEKTYYVLFDNYESDFTKDSYVNMLLDNQEDHRVYKVDMSLKSNEKYINKKENAKAQSVKDLKINGVTLMKVSNGKNAKYISGSEKIEEYLK